MTEKIELKTSSIQDVALKLTETIASSENLYANKKDTDFRKKYLDLYAECLDAVTGNRKYSEDKNT